VEIVSGGLKRDKNRTLRHPPEAINLKKNWAPVAFTLTAS
jgi:hypothetical protein